MTIGWKESYSRVLPPGKPQGDAENQPRPFSFFSCRIFPEKLSAVEHRQVRSFAPRTAEAGFPSMRQNPTPATGGQRLTTTTKADVRGAQFPNPVPFCANLRCFLS